MQRFITETMEAAEESGVPPTQQYAEVNNTHFDGSQYTFPPESNDFTNIDHNLDMSSSFQAHGEKREDPRMNNHNLLAAPNGHNDIVASQSGLANISPALQSAPSTSQPPTPHNPPTKRKTPDDTSDATPPGGDAKRRRSKVTRACDQCRRKKIRCDYQEDPVTHEVMTCSHCVKAEQHCQFSRQPQKRGPSKGYIKELSERVQQVEGQLALQNSTVYRGSFDGQVGAFPDAPFSPDEDQAPRRQSSFSQQRSPFADVTRDRFPSIGGWNNTTSHPRDRASIAIPPDQLLTSQLIPTESTPKNITKPFWTEWYESPAKRRKISIGESDVSKEDEMAFNHYYDNIHPYCPVLPKLSVLLSILGNASEMHQQAFSGVMALMPQKRNDRQSTNAEKILGQPMNRAELEQFVVEQRNRRVLDSTNVDNIVFVWTSELMVVVVQQDYDSWFKSDLPLRDVLRTSLDICDEVFRVKIWTEEPLERQEWTRCVHISAMFARLYSTAMGRSNDPVPSTLHPYLNAPGNVIPPRVSFTVYMSESLHTSLLFILDQNTITSANDLYAFTRFRDQALRGWLAAAGLTREDPVVREIEAFADLVALRVSHRYARPSMIAPAAKLAEAVRVSFEAVENSTSDRSDIYVFNPLSFYSFTLAVITLLELLQCNFDGDPLGSSLVADGLKGVRECLSMISQKELEFDSYPRGNRFWARVLIEMINEKWAPGLGHLQPTPRRKEEEELAVDMGLLLQRGFMSVVLDFVARTQEGS